VLMAHLPLGAEPAEFPRHRRWPVRAQAELRPRPVLRPILL